MSVARIGPGPVDGTVRAPPSKSYTHRFVLAAHLSGRPGRVRRPLVSDDTLRTARAARQLGSTVDLEKGVWTISPGPLRLPRGPRIVDCGESGTTLRLLAAAAALSPARFRFVGSGRLPFRPISPLLAALERLGATVARADPDRAVPFSIQGPLHGGTVELEVGESSQFTSALLFALPTVRPGSRLLTLGTPVSEPYVHASIEVLRRLGVRLTRTRVGYRIPGGQRYRAVDVEVPGDASSAAYLWAASAITGGRATVTGITARWPQADLAVLELLHGFGAIVSRAGPAVTVRGDGHRPFRAELTHSPDLYPLAGVLAAVAPGRSCLLGGGQAAAKESDRVGETMRLVRAMGARAVAVRDGLAIEGVARPRALRLRGLRDHRLVMSAAVAAMAADGPSEIADASAVAKSFPTFFGVLRELGAEVTVR